MPEFVASHELWTIVRNVTGIAAAICVFVATISGYILSNIEGKSRTAESAEETALENAPQSAWPTWKLKRDGFADEGGLRDDGLKILIKRPKKRTDTSIVTTFAVKGAGDHTLAFGKAFVVGDNLVWPYSRQDLEHLYDGSIPVALDDAIRASPLVAEIMAASMRSIDVVAIGLESSAGGDKEDIYRSLSVERASALMHAAAFVIEEANIEVEASYRSLGLGRSRNAAIRDTDREKRQRRALVFVIERVSNDVQQFGLESVLQTVILDFDLISDADLSHYEYAQALQTRLSPALAVGDAPKGETWKLPEVTPEEAAILRSESP